MLKEVEEELNAELINSPAKETKFLLFREFKKEKNSYLVMNKKDGSPLGVVVGLFPKWNKFVFYTEGECVFDSFCLDDISSFMKELNNPKKEASEDVEYTSGEPSPGDNNNTLKI